MTDWGISEYIAYSVSGDGRRFACYGNPVGGFYDLFLADSRTGGWTQIMNTDVHSANPDLSLEGGWVAFTSQADFVGANSDGNLEVFLVELASGLYIQVTDTQEASIVAPRTSPEGLLTLFHTYLDLTGGNPDGSIECFLFDRISGETTQVVSGDRDHSCVMDAEGRAILVSTTDDLLGLNADGNSEIYRVDVASGLLTQLTQTTTGGNRALWATDDGARIAFLSTSLELFPVDHEGQAVLLYDLVGPRISFVEDANSSTISLELSGAGNRIAAALNGEIQLWDLVTNERRSLYAPLMSVARARAIDRWGTRFYTYMRDDATGGNPDHTLEIFRFDCPMELFADGLESGDSSRWSLTLP